MQHEWQRRTISQLHFRELDASSTRPVWRGPMRGKDGWCLDGEVVCIVVESLHCIHLDLNLRHYIINPPSVHHDASLPKHDIESSTFPDAPVGAPQQPSC